MVKRIVITGGPGAGKTTLVNTLKKRGYAISEEVSRQLIRQEASKPKGVFPWNNLQAFAGMALRAMKEAWLFHQKQNNTVFYDRGIPDIQAYLECNNLLPEQELSTSLKQFRYHNMVFWCPPWEEIYTNDPERPQSYNEAQMLGYKIKQVYELHQYQIIEVPKQKVEIRAKFVEHKLSARAQRNVYRV